ncbi:MAG: histidine kinase [Oligoflexia bacterium]|nr:histidine kinase [Oligoflexia bacterium]
MSQNDKIKPFISLISLIAIALVYVFLKMEITRTSYEVLKWGRQVKIVSQERSRLEISYSRLTRPERLDQIATQQLSLVRANKNQVILMAAQGDVAIRQ